jgi:hypothetical protein
VLGWLGAGMTEEQILEEHPDLEKADFAAVYQFAAENGRKTNLGAIAREGKEKKPTLSTTNSVIGPELPRIARTARRLGRMIPEKESRRMPKDLSSQIDHYICGTPKR